jgi:hypothetical protein
MSFPLPASFRMFGEGEQEVLARSGSLRRPFTGFPEELAGEPGDLSRGDTGRSAGALEHRGRLRGHGLPLLEFVPSHFRGAGERGDTGAGEPDRKPLRNGAERAHRL